MNSEVATVLPGGTNQPKSTRYRFSAEDKALIISDCLAPQAGGKASFTEQQKALFIRTAELRRLHPLLRQIYAILRWSGRNKRWEMSIETSIDGQRALCERPGDFEGLVGPQWCGTDGEWRDVWLEADPPAAARVGVWRAGFREPTWGTVRWGDYAKTGSDGTMWRTMGPHMLSKCAEGLARRAAFPEECSGLYIKEEMESAAAEDLRAAPSEQAPEQAPKEAVGDDAVLADWIQQIEQAPSVEDLDDVGGRIKDAELGELSKKLKTPFKARQVELLQLQDRAGGA